MNECIDSPRIEIQNLYLFISGSTNCLTMPQGPSTNPLMKPLVVLALPGMYLFYKYNQYKRKKKENARRRMTEKELLHLNNKIVSKHCAFIVFNKKVRLNMNIYLRVIRPCQKTNLLLFLI